MKPGDALAVERSPIACPVLLVFEHSGKLVISADAVILVIKTMFERDWNYLPAQMRSREQDFRHLTLELLGVEIGVDAFIKKAQFRFKNWRNAVEQVGPYQPKHTDWDRIDWPQILRDIHDDDPNKEGMTFRVIKDDVRHRVRNQLAKRGIDVHPSTFVDALLLRGGNRWERVLQLAQIEDNTPIKTAAWQWSPPDVAYALQYIYLSHPSMYAVDLTQHSAQIRNESWREFGTGFSGRVVYEWAQKHFGDLYAALEFAGFDTTLALATRPFVVPNCTKPRLKNILLALNEAGIDLHPETFLLSWREVEAASSQLFGHAYSSFDIWRLALKHFKNWVEAVHKSIPNNRWRDLDAETFMATQKTRLRLKRKNQTWTNHQVWIEVLQQSPLRKMRPEVFVVFEEYFNRYASFEPLKNVYRYLGQSNLSPLDRELAPLILERLRDEFERQPKRLN